MKNLKEILVPSQTALVMPQEPDYPTLSLGVGCGLMAHHVLFKHGEWHLHAGRIALAHTTLSACVLALDLLLGADTKWHIQHPTTGLNFVIGYFVGLISSIASYRMLFHRLNRFRGPRWARLSKLWQAVNNIATPNHILVRSLQQDYGDIFRIGPNELICVSPNLHQLLDNPKTGCTKSDWWDITFPSRSLLFTRDEKLHEARRRVWTKALKPNELRSYLPRIIRKVGILQQIVEQAALKTLSLRFDELIVQFTFDAMGDFAFGRGFSLLESLLKRVQVASDQGCVNMAIESREIATLRDMSDNLGTLNPVTWVIHLFRSLFPFAKAVKDRETLLVFCRQMLAERMSNPPNIPDITSHFLDVIDPERLTSEEMLILEGDTLGVVTAGTDTTAGSIIMLVYCLAQHPAHIQKISDELRTVDIYAFNVLDNLTHLNACIKESQRLWPVHPSFHPRTTSANGLQLDGTRIPGLVNISCPRILLGRSDRFWTRPDDFIPERWTTESMMIHDKRAFVPFGAGKHSCPGEQLALLEVRLIVAMLVKNFAFEHAKGHDCDQVVKEMKDLGTMRPGPLHLCFSLKGRRT